MSYGKPKPIHGTTKVLKRALKLLETKGWTRGMFFDEDNKTYCAVGAVQATVRGRTARGAIRDRDYDSAGYEIEASAEAVLNYICDEVLPPKQRTSGIITYNDKRGRKFDQVRRVFERAIEFSKENERKQTSA